MCNWRQKPSIVMAQEIGVSRTTICRIANECGVKPSLSVKISRSKKEVMQDRIQWIRQQGTEMTVRQIAGVLGVSCYCIYKMIGRYGLKVKMKPEAVPEPMAAVYGSGRKGMFDIHQRESWLV
jgi:hypothetical protein